MDIFEKSMVEEYQSLKTECEKRIEDQTYRLRYFIEEFKEGLNEFSSSPIIPPEEIKAVTSKSNIVLRRLMNNYEFLKIVLDHFIKSMDYSTDIHKFKAAIEELEIAIPRFKDFFKEYINGIAMFSSLWKDMCAIDDYWCKQHLTTSSLPVLNGTDLTCGNVDFFHELLCSLKELCDFANELYKYAKHQNKSCEGFLDDIS